MSLANRRLRAIRTGTRWMRWAMRSARAAALADPDAQPIAPGSDEELARMGLSRLVNVKKLRERLGLTQEAFAAIYHIPVGTLRDWEQRRKTPDAPARVYLTVIARNPEAVAQMLRQAA